jgi:hypothetical protein
MRRFSPTRLIGRANYIAWRVGVNANAAVWEDWRFAQNVL